MNSVVFQGKLVGHPEKRYTLNNVPVVSFSIAVPKKVKKEGQPTADFFDCSAWDRDADNIHKFFSQGDTILIRGRIENNNYVNREGVKIKGQLVIVEDWGFGPKKKAD